MEKVSAKLLIIKKRKLEKHKFKHTRKKSENNDRVSIEIGNI